ncbi:nitronate monooxygenase [Fragilaria crotonensis]|nr:nitronate monooxygenase [Fragilaria crotonensis]
MKAASSWKTKFTQSFQCPLPIMGAPMAGVSGGVLAAATTRAGALGFVAAGHADNLPQLDEQIDLFRQHAPKDSPLALGFITHSSCAADFTKLETILQRHKPKYVQFFAPAICTLQVSPTCQKTNIQIAQEHGAQVLVQVGSIADERSTICWCRCHYCTGIRVRGHGLRRDLGSGTLSLAGRVAKLVALRDEHHRDIPVLVAGGMVNGHSWRRH